MTSRTRDSVHIHPSKPYADGILFDELHGLSTKACNRIAPRGVVFLTEFKANGRRYGGSVIAPDFSGAEDIAFSRSLGETVVGVLVQTGDHHHD